jgi:hypothetical protein
MWVRVLEVGLFALVGLALAARLLRRAARKTWRVPAGSADGGDRPAAGPDRARRLWAGWVGGTLFAVALVNFLALSVHADALGGSADTTRRDEERYYFSSHGR